MSYFRELPNLDYQSPLSSKNSSLDYVRVKNLFRRVKLRDDLQNVFTIFNKYIIPDGARPDTIAEELYGSAELDWVVLITGGIVNVREQWPLSDRDLYNFSLNKYGLTDLNAVKYYVTTEVKDSNNRLILPAGKVVDSSFTIPNPSNGLATLNPVTAVSNYEYEVEKNNKKRELFILKPEYLGLFLTDMRKIMFYDKSSQYVNERLIKTENTLNTSP
jgi:hypothetical protein